MFREWFKEERQMSKYGKDSVHNVQHKRRTIKKKKILFFSVHTKVFNNMQMQILPQGRKSC